MFSVSTAATRSKHAAWLSIAAFGWPEPRLRHELQNGWPYRTFPPRSIDWHDPNVSIDPTRGMVTIVTGAGEVSKGDGALAFIWRGRDRQTLALELLAPPDALADGEVPSLPPPSAGAPAASVRRWRKRPPRDDVEAAALAVAKTYQPDNKPTQPEWREAFNAQFPEPVTRKVALDALDKYAKHLKRRPGQTKRNRQS